MVECKNNKGKLYSSNRLSLSFYDREIVYSHLLKNYPVYFFSVYRFIGIFFLQKISLTKTLFMMKLFFLFALATFSVNSFATPILIKPAKNPKINAKMF